MQGAIALIGARRNRLNSPRSQGRTSMRKLWMSGLVDRRRAGRDRIASCRPRRRATATNVATIPHEAVPNFFKNSPGIYTGENMGIATNSKGNIYIYHRANETRLFEYTPQGVVHPRDWPQQLRLLVRAFGARRRAGQHLGGRRRHRHARQVQPRGPDPDDDRPPRGSGRHAVEHAGQRPLTTAATRSTASAARPTSRSISRATSSSPTATSTAASSSTTRTAAS